MDGGEPTAGTRMSSPMSTSSSSSRRFRSSARGICHRLASKRLHAVFAARLLCRSRELGIRSLSGRRLAEFLAIGEQETYSLRDGSSVALNTRSRVRLDWSDQYRDVHLESGEVLFEVAKDLSRPFRVLDRLVDGSGGGHAIQRVSDG